MPRPLRVRIPGGIYHVTARGNRRQDIYFDDADRLYFLAVLNKVIQRFGWRCYAYCLMTNHYHLVVETPGANISEGMQRLNSVYAQWINWRYGYEGHLFQGRFHSTLVDSNWHLLELCRYVPSNPVRAGLCERPGDWRWSSYRAAMGMSPCPDHLTVTWVIDQFGPSPEQAREHYARFVADAPARAGP